MCMIWSNKDRSIGKNFAIHYLPILVVNLLGFLLKTFLFWNSRPKVLLTVLKITPFRKDQAKFWISLLNWIICQIPIYTLTIQHSMASLDIVPTPGHILVINSFVNEDRFHHQHKKNSNKLPKMTDISLSWPWSPASTLTNKTNNCCNQTIFPTTFQIPLKRMLDSSSIDATECMWTILGLNFLLH